MTLTRIIVVVVGFVIVAASATFIALVIAAKPRRR